MNIIIVKIKAFALKLRSKLKGFSVILGLIITLFVIFSFSANIFSYFDPVNLCYIGIDNDILRGNQKTIKKAISYIKNNDNDSYKILCKYVDTIFEDYCLNGDIRGGVQDTGYSSPGCYIRGSKIIYLIPSQNESETLVNFRVSTIVKYARASKNYWENN